MLKETGMSTRWPLLVALIVLPPLIAPAWSQSISVPNGSFESPALANASPYAGPDIAVWQKSPAPAWWTQAGYSAEQWTDSAGVFVNVPFAPVAGADGNQLAFMFSVPGYELYQTLSTTYQVGQSYQLTVGIQGGGYGMQIGCPMAIELYYPDAGGNRIPIGSTTILNNNATGVLSQLTDYTLTIPAVAATQAWAGQPIGIDLVQTATTAQAGGYWDIDNVRLTAAATRQLTWTGLASGNWNMKDANWQQAGAAATYSDGAAVVFGDAGANTDISIQQAGVCPASVTFSNTTTVYTLSGGAISGTAGLVLNGGGTVVLAGANSYTGGTSVDDGLLVLDSSEAILSGSTLATGPDGAVVLGDPSLPSDGAAVGGVSGHPLAVHAAPEPGTLALLLAAAAGGLAVWRRKG
jgi:autotransporter-associated beta strand protein